MRIPAIIILGACWVMIMISGGIGAKPIFDGINRIGAPLNRTTVAFVIIILGTQFLITVWGAVELLLASRGSTHKFALYRVVGIALFSSALLTAFGISYGNLFTFLCFFFFFFFFCCVKQLIRGTIIFFYFFYFFKTKNFLTSRFVFLCADGVYSS